MDDPPAAVHDDPSDDVQEGRARGDGFAVRVGIREPHEDVPEVGDDRDEPRHRLAGLELLRREARPAPLVLELVEVVLAVPSVSVELGERGQVQLLLVGDENAVVPLPTLPVLGEVELQLLRSFRRCGVRTVWRGQLRPFERDGRDLRDVRPADEDAASGELPRAEPDPVLTSLPSAAAIRPPVILRQEREKLLRQPRALDLEEVGEPAGLGLRHDAVAAVADVAAQEVRPEAAGYRVEERPQAPHAADAGVLLPRQDVHAERDSRAADEERVVVVARASRLLRVVAELRSLLVPENRLHRVVDVDDVGEAQHRVDHLVLVARKPCVEGLPVGVAQGPSHGVLGHDLPQAQQLHRGGVVPERVDLHVPVLAEQDRQHDRPDDVAPRARVVAPVVDREVRAEAVEEPRHLEEDREIGESSR